MSKNILVAIILTLISVVCIAGVWQNYDNIANDLYSESPSLKTYYHDGFIWGISGSGIWRFNPETFEQGRIYPVDWLGAGGKIRNYMISKNGDHLLLIQNVGLVRFDGINWYLDRLREYSDSAYGIAEDADGRIWLTVSDGLVFFDGNNWQLIDMIKDTPIDSGFKLICSDNEGNIWLAFRGTSQDDFLAKRTNDSWTVYPLPEDEVFYDLNYRIYADESGGIWFTGGYEKKKIVRFYDGTFSPQESMYSLKSFAQGTDGSTWIQDAGFYIHHIIGEECVTYEPRELSQDYSELHVGEITALPDGSLWAFMYHWTSNIPFDVIKIKDGVMQKVDASIPIFPPSPVRISLKDNHGAILSGTSLVEMKDINNPYDLNLLDFNIGNYYTEDLFIDSSNRIWLAGRGTFVSFDDDVPTYHHKDDSWWPDRGEARAIAEGPDGTIWLGMKEQLFSYKDNIWTEEIIDSYNLPVSIDVDSSGVLWMACNTNGLFKYDGQTCTKVDVPDAIKDVSADSKGAVWVAATAPFLDESNGGLYYILDGNITRYTEEDGLPSKVILNVEVAPDDTVWFSFRDIIIVEDGWNKYSGGGVCHLYGENIETYRPADGLASYKINDIAVSGEGIVWFATDAGLSTFNNKAIPEPKIRTAVSKHILKEGDQFKLGVNLQNPGPEREVKLVLAILCQDMIFLYNFQNGQFSANYSDKSMTLQEDQKTTSTYWELDVPAGLSGLSCICASGLFDAGSFDLIGDVSVQNIKFVE